MSSLPVSGTALSLLLAFRDVSQKALAEELGIERSNVSRWVNGEVAIPERRRSEILGVLHLTSLAWAYAEVLAVHLGTESERFAEAAAKAEEIGEGDLPESELTDRSAYPAESPVAEQDDALAAWVGASTEAFTRGLTRLLRERSR